MQIPDLHDPLELIETMSLGDVETRGKHLHKDMDQILELLAGMPFNGSIAQLLEDLGCIRTMFALGLDSHEVKAAEASKCRSCFSSSRFMLLRKALDQTPCGTEFYSSVASLMRRSVEDELGDQRLTQAAATLCRGLLDVAVARRGPSSDRRR